MAKKKEEVSISGASDILKIVSSFDDNSEILNESKSSVIKEYLGTGSYILNAGMSGSIFGGVPSGRVVSFASEAGCLPKNEKVEIYILKDFDLNHEIIRNLQE